MRGAGILSNPLFWAGVVCPLVLLAGIYHQSFVYMVEIWSRDENYGHAFLVPLVSLYLIWEKRHAMRTVESRGTWWGLAVVIAGIGLFTIGEFSTLYGILHLSLWVVCVGLLLSAVGIRAVREIAFPLFYFLMMIPLPNFLYQGLSGQLQLISSILGVGFLQAVGVTVFREGNIIDLGSIQLQVVEACSGIRYLFPLAALSLLCAYFYNDRFWKRAVLFLSSLPVSVFLNGFRIGATGILVDLYGRGPAEGFFHGFSGWLLFLSGISIFIGEMWLLNRITFLGGPYGGRRRAFREIFAWPGRGDKSPVGFGPFLSTSFLPNRNPAYYSSLACLVPVLFVSTLSVTREEVPPPRMLFDQFPMEIGEWEGRNSVLEPVYVNALRFDDYLLADYRGPDALPVNFYVAYYDSQRKGESAHSPRSCIPGGGWEITSIRPLEITNVAGSGNVLPVNRVVIQKGDDKQIVYYWFQQRGRLLTSEYRVKYYLFWDAMTRNRTDGALVRLAVAVPRGESESRAEGKLAEFTRLAFPRLTPFIPNS